VLKTNPYQLLQSVVNLTSTRDLFALETCLITTLQEIISAYSITFYEIEDCNDYHALNAVVRVNTQNPVDGTMQEENQLPLVMEQDASILHSYLTNTQVVVSSRQHSGVSVIHPVQGINKITGFLVIDCESLVQKDQDMAAGFMRIYYNWLQLINDNERDTLTGLLNRKTFDAQIEKTLIAAHSEKKRSDDIDHPDYLAILDIDHFKKINDKFGHLYGDEVLLLFANVMRQTFRDRDQLFRYGGEEFVVILKNIPSDMAMTVLERFRKKVESQIFPQIGNVTVSIGYVTIAEQNLPSTVIEQADHALYHAKEHGRNQVCSFDTLQAEGKICPEVAYSNDIEMF
jgi:diguanylate cyclase (GGDEF)-like protein